MTQRLRFGILGPLEVSCDGTRVPVGGRRQRALLAMLLCNSRRVVAQDRLVDALLPAVPPESAHRMLRVQISRLRKALDSEGEPSRVVAVRPGYELRLHDEELDAERFEQLISSGRRAAALGDLAGAVEHWRLAESLWRGDPLGEFADEPFAQLEVQRLTELHEAARDERLAAQLELGHHVLVLPELETRVVALPLRERPREQLMLALYRSGRQVEALESYRAYRRLLVDELGLEPSPALSRVQRSILSQSQREPAAAALAGSVASGQTIDTSVDTSVGSAVDTAAGAAAAEDGSRTPLPFGQPLSDAAGARRDPPRPAVRRRSLRALLPRRPRLTLAVVGCVALTAAATITATPGLPETPGPARATPGMTLLRDDGSAVLTLPLTAAPGAAASGFGGLWTVEPSAGALVHIDPSTRRIVTTMPVGGSPVKVVPGEATLWVADGVDRTVTAVDPFHDVVTRTIDVGVTPADITEDGGALWVADSGDATVLRVDPAGARPPASVHLRAPAGSLAVAAGAVWALSQKTHTLTRIDPATASVAATVAVGDAPSSVVAQGSDLWVLDPIDVTATRIDARTASITAVVQLSGRPTSITAGVRSVWVADRDHGRLQRIDTGAALVVQSAQVDQVVESMSVADGLWVATSGGLTSHAGGTLTFATEGVLDSLDPASSTSINWSPPQLFGLMHDTLVTLDHSVGEDGTRLVPDLALRLPEPADHGLSYTFQLRSGIRYSDGTPVRASDVPRSLERLFTLHSSGAAYFSAILGTNTCTASPETCDLSSGVVARDDANTVTFRLQRPDPDFLYKLALVYASVVPASTPRRESRDALPATGPYVASRYRLKQELTLVRNPVYREWSSAAQPSGTPDTIVIRFGVPSAEASAAVRSGRSDFHRNVGGVQGLDLARLGAADHVEIRPLLATSALAININAPPFDDVRVRRALNLALDRARIVTAYGGPGAATPTCQILPPAMPGYRPYCPYTVNPGPDGAWHAPDPATAQRLVQESGTAGMHVTVWTTPGPHVAVAESQIAVDALNALGYRADLRTLPDDTFFTYTNDSRNRAQVIDGGWGADYPSANNFLGKLTCEYFVPGDGAATTDASGLCDPAYDALVAQAARLATTDPEEANRRWAQLDQRLTDLAIWLPTVTPNNVDMLSARVGNYQYHPLWGALIDQFWLSEG